MTLRRLVLIFALVCAALSAAQFAGACRYKVDIPTEFPTPPRAISTPIPKLALKRDPELELQFARIAEAAKGKVGAMAVELETGNAAILNADEAFPMQSVYKLPISMAMLDQVRLQRFDLDEQIGVTKEDMVRSGMASPLRDKSPGGGEFTIRELTRLSMVESDGTASDVLMRVLGGAPEVQSFLVQIGVRDLNVVDSEKEIGRDWETQYGNSSTPTAACEILRWLAAAGQSSGDEAAEWQLLLRFMNESNPGAKRLKGELPAGTYVAHKTGTGGTREKITSATNDIGLIRMPNGRTIAIAVFVSDSPADVQAREGVIAKIAKAAWDRWSR